MIGDMYKSMFGMNSRTQVATVSPRLSIKIRGIPQDNAESNMLVNQLLHTKAQKFKFKMFG